MKENTSKRRALRGRSRALVVSAAVLFAGVGCAEEASDVVSEDIDTRSKVQAAAPQDLDRRPQASIDSDGSGVVEPRGERETITPNHSGPPAIDSDEAAARNPRHQITTTPTSEARTNR